MNGMTAIREHAGVSGFKRPYSDVDNDLSYSGRYSRSRLDYDPEMISRVGNDPEVGYGAGNRAGGIRSGDYLPRRNVIEVPLVHIDLAVARRHTTDIV